MGSPGVRSFTVAQILSLTTGQPFATTADVNELASYLVGRSVDTAKLHGMQILALRRELTLQQPRFSTMKPVARDPREDSDTGGAASAYYLEGFLDAAQALGFPDPKDPAAPTVVFIKGGTVQL